MSIPITVLLVDDHSDTREMYAFALIDAGYKVVEAADATDAIAAANESLPAVLVTDMRMPGPVRAVDLCRHFAPLGVKVIVVTGVGPGKEHEEVTAAGCTVVAMKPLAPDRLLEQIARVLRSVALEGPSDS